MSERLKRIQAPTLGSSYGANIESTFANINSNFGVVGNQDFVKGDKGTSVAIFNTSWSSLLDSEGSEYSSGNNQFNLPDQSQDIKDSLNFGDELDVNTFVENLSKYSAENIIICFDETQAGAAECELTYVFPIVAMDERFYNTSDSNYPSNLSGLTDMSCVLSCQGGTWSAVQAFPTLYYDGIQLKWKINGQNTEIDARGIQGANGRPAVTWVGKCTYSSSNNMQTITHFLIENTWKSVNQLPSGSNPQTGDLIYVLPDASGDNRYWISSLYIDSGVYKACCNSGDFRTASINNLGFQSVMAAINPAGTNKGLFVPDKMQFSDTTDKGFIIKNTAANELTIAKTSNTGSTETSGGTLKSMMNLNVAGDINATGDINITGNFDVLGSDIKLGDEGSKVSECLGAAVGEYSHAEGGLDEGENEGTTAYAPYSHAEGRATCTGVVNDSSVGIASHSEGYFTLARGNYSHAEGNGTSAKGNASHAEGIGTVTNFEGEHACGKYNLSGKIYACSEIFDDTVIYAVVPPTTSGDILDAEGHTWQNDLYYGEESYGHTLFSVGCGDSNADYERANALMCSNYGYTFVAELVGQHIQGYLKSGLSFEGNQFQTFRKL